jgi:hypothetical protein
MNAKNISNKNEEGFVIVFVLMILVVVSIIGISAITTSLTEQKVARNEMLHKSNFYNTDHGPYTVAKLVSRTINDKEGQDAGDYGMTFLPEDKDPAVLKTTLFRQIMGFDDHDGGAKDVGFEDTTVDIKRGRTKHAAGGSTEFASGDGGIGTGSKGGIEIFVHLDTDGSDGQNRSLNIIGVYRKLPDITGGL